MTRHRADICSAAADALRTADLKDARSVVGFDGFIDSIISVVDQRSDMGASGYTPLKTIESFAVRVGAASGKSTNIELVVHEERFGGNGPLMAGALGRLGAPVTFIGCVGRPDDPRRLHPIYEPFAARCEKVIPVSPPATTEALEFDDGKVMLGKTHNIQRVTWELLVESIGLDTLRAMFGSARLIGMVNWVMMGGVESIWEGLRREVFPGLAGPRYQRRIFIDLCDPNKRTDADLRRALAMLSKMDEAMALTLGLNLSEAERIAQVLGLDVFGSYEGDSRRETIREAAVEIRRALGLTCVVVHPRDGAAAAVSEHGRESSAWFDGPFTKRPRLSTGAGDHFNAGFGLAQTLGLDVEACLAVGCATSGVYVRDAQSASKDRLIEFLQSMPAAE